MAPEIYQRKQHELLAGLDGVEPIADDILIVGCGETDEAAIQDHDTKLLALMQRCREVKMRMSLKKTTIQGQRGQVLTTLQKEHHEAENRLNDVEDALSVADSHITALESICEALAAANGLLKAKVNDLGSRSRRLNIRIVGIKEGEENGRPTEFVTRLILELLGRDNFTKPVKIDRAHRSLRAKPLMNERPRIIIARVHNDRDLLIRGIIEATSF